MRHGTTHRRGNTAPTSDHSEKARCYQPCRPTLRAQYRRMTWSSQIPRSEFDSREHEGLLMRKPKGAHAMIPRRNSSPEPKSASSIRCVKKGYMIRLVEPFPAESWLQADPLYAGYLQYDPSQPSSLTTNDWVSKELLRITSWIHAGFSSRTPKAEFKTPCSAGKESFIRFENPLTSHAHV